MARWPVLVVPVASICLVLQLCNKPAQAKEPLLVERTPPVTAQQSYSVSASDFMGLPARKGARAQRSNPIIGPSEAELRGIFLRAVNTAIHLSPEVSRSQAEKQAVLWDIDEAKGQRWPQIDVASQSKSLQFGKGVEREDSNGGINLSVSTLLYDWGRVGKTIDSREKLGVASDEKLAAQMETTGYEVVSTLIELGKQRIISDLGQQFSNRMEDLVKMLSGIVAVDPGRASELTQAKARLLQAQALHDAAQAKARDAEINLNKWVGESPVPIPRNKEWNIGLASMEPLLIAVQNHPTLRQSMAQVESAQLQAEALRASGLPQLKLVVSKNTGTDALGRQQPWQAKVDMTWSAFRGGSTRASERAALQRADAGRFDMSLQRRNLEFRIRAANNDARTLFERAEQYRELALESDRIRDAFHQQWYHLGKRTLLDVLGAENDHHGNLVSEITNRFDGYQAIVRQYASAGMLVSWLRGNE